MRCASLRSTALVLGLLVLPTAAPALPPDDAPAEPYPVVVELFTSQGCATCPPADRLLDLLAKELGSRIVPLAFHVDSWNHDGWVDPFSSAAWTRRHAAYVRALRAEGAYTPQAVVDGAAEVLGSDAGALRAAIAAAAQQPAGRLDLELRAGLDLVQASIAVELPPELRGRKLDLLVAVFETGLETRVGRGENGGRTLHDDFVVRSLTRAGRLPASPEDASGVSHHDVSLRVAKDWNRAHLGVAAFLQDPRDLAIHGARSRVVEIER